MTIPVRGLLRVAALVPLLLVPAPAHAATLTGAFVEKGAATPLPAVEVVLRSAADSTVVAHATTGPDGRFRLDALPFGRYLLRATLLGHAPYHRADIALTEGAPALDLGTQALAVSAIALPGVEARTARPTLIVAGDRNIYETKDTPAAATGTATDLLRTVPELDVDPDGKVSLRGSPSVTFQFNGRAAPLTGEALTNYLRQLPARRIARVEVVAHPSAKFDPEGTAGIINLVFDDRVALGWSGSLSATAGWRYSSPGAHVAWQRGPFTLFGGLNGSLYRYTYGSVTTREDLLHAPPSVLTSGVDSKYTGRSGTGDASIDYALSKHSTLYATLNAIVGSNDPHARTGYAQTDSTQALADRIDRDANNHSESRTRSFTLGLQHQVEAGRNERSLEVRENVTDGNFSNLESVRTPVPAGTPDEVLRGTGANGYLERALQTDDTHALGAHGKLELGYRGAERRSASSSTLLTFLADSAAASSPAGLSDYAHRERFHSAYLTVSGTRGRWSLTGGARAEFAHTTFVVHSSGERFEDHYRNLFPSANLAWNWGKGRTLRATYTKRVERPSPYMLNPDVPASDSLNRFVGNPRLRPKYTHTWGLDASWTGSPVVVIVSPYWRETVHSWDVFTQVDATGAATSTYLNASSVRAYGISVTLSLPQEHRFGGSLSAGASHERHDASNLSSLGLRSLTSGSANANLNYKATEQLSLQGYLRYAPARALAQGRSSSYTALSLGAHWKFNPRSSAGLWFTDPFDLARYSSSTGEVTYAQESTTHNHQRSVSASFNWSWGKPPEEKPRRQKDEAPASGTPGAEP